MPMGQARLPTKSGFEPATMTDHGWPLGPLLWMALTDHLLNTTADHGWLLGQSSWLAMAGHWANHHGRACLGFNQPSRPATAGH